MFPNDFGNEHYMTNDDRLAMNRGSSYGIDGLPKLNNGNNGGGTKSQASTASSSATRDSGISVTDAQRAADEHRCACFYINSYLYLIRFKKCIVSVFNAI